MAIVPASHTFGNGIADSSEANTYIRDPIAFLLAKPLAELRQTVAQSLTTSTFTGITFDVEDYDLPAGQHDTAVNSSRFTAVYAGWYHCTGGVGYAASATGRRASRWAVNGTGQNGSQTIGVATATGVCQVAARGKNIYLAIGDYVELQGFQDTGGALNTDVATSGQSHMSVFWVSN